MAKVIKRGNEELTQVSGPRRSPIIDRDTFDARAEGQQIRERAQSQADGMVADARAEAERIVAEAETQAEQMRSAAEREGRASGREEGAQSLLEVVATAAQRMQKIEADLIPQLTTLAVHIARKVLGRELEFHPEAVVEIVRNAIHEKARQRREVVLRIHPEDAEAVRNHRAELIELLSRSKEIGIIEDSSVARYGVIIDTDAGSIDAQLETQLDALQRALQTVA